MYLNTGRWLAGEGYMQNHDGLPGDGTVCEDETSSIGTHTVLEVLPVAQGMNCLVQTDLEEW